MTAKAGNTREFGTVQQASHLRCRESLAKTAHLGGVMIDRIVTQVGEKCGNGLKGKVEGGRREWEKFNNFHGRTLIPYSKQKRKNHH